MMVERQKVERTKAANDRLRKNLPFPTIFFLLNIYSRFTTTFFSSFRSFVLRPFKLTFTYNPNNQSQILNEFSIQPSLGIHIPSTRQEWWLSDSLAPRLIHLRASAPEGINYPVFPFVHHKHCHPRWRRRRRKSHPRTKITYRTVRRMVAGDRGGPVVAIRWNTCVYHHNSYALLIQSHVCWFFCCCRQQIALDNSQT